MVGVLIYYCGRQRQDVGQKICLLELGCHACTVVAVETMFVAMVITKADRQTGVTRQFQQQATHLHCQSAILLPISYHSNTSKHQFKTTSTRISYFKYVSVWITTTRKHFNYCSKLEKLASFL